MKIIEPNSKHGKEAIKMNNVRGTQNTLNMNNKQIESIPNVKRDKFLPGEK